MAATPPVVTVRQVEVQATRRTGGEEGMTKKPSGLRPSCVSGRPRAPPAGRRRLHSTALVFLLLLLTVLVAPIGTLVAAGGPRLLSAEYELRSLNVGTVQRAASPGELTHTDSSGSGSASYELAWSGYEFAAIDLIFDQPLYITSARAVLAANGGGGTAAAGGQYGQPISPHRTNHTALPALDGAIVLECPTTAGGEDTSVQQFSLTNRWPGTADDATTVEADYWTSPTDQLLPLYSQHNSLKADIVQLFDRRVDQTRSIQSTSLFAATAGQDAATLASVVGRPNVLSLMLMLSFESSEGTRRFMQVDEAHRSPLAHCKVTYVSVTERLEAQRDLLSNTTSSSVVPPPPDLSLSSGLTNFRGAEVDFSAASLTVRKGAQTAWVQQRSLVRVQEGLEDDFSEDAADSSATSSEVERERRDEKDEQPYAHSPLDPPATPKIAGAASSSSPPSSSSSLSLSSSWSEDPFNNILLDVASGVGFVQLILKPITNGVMKPATKGTNDLLLDDIMTELGTNLFDSVVDEVSPDVNIMLGTALQTSLSNILQDSLSYAITKSLTQAITADVAPYVIDRLIKNLPGPLHTIVHSILEKKIPDRLERTMPVILSRVLSVTLTHSLTRAIPHVVVPTVSHSLGLGHAGSFSRPKYYWEVCQRCYLQAIGKIPPVRMAPPDMNPDGYDSGIGSGGVRPGSECGACPTSTYSMYYGIYHAAYYTDFYSSVLGEREREREGARVWLSFRAHTHYCFGVCFLLSLSSANTTPSTTPRRCRWRTRPYTPTTVLLTGPAVHRQMRRRAAAQAEKVAQAERMEPVEKGPPGKAQTALQAEKGMPLALVVIPRPMVLARMAAPVRMVRARMAAQQPTAVLVETPVLLPVVMLEPVVPVLVAKLEPALVALLLEAAAVAARRRRAAASSGRSSRRRRVPRRVNWAG